MNLSPFFFLLSVHVFVFNKIENKLVFYSTCKKTESLIKGEE
jgi:hypothetical protein